MQRYVSRRQLLAAAAAGSALAACNKTTNAKEGGAAELASGVSPETLQSSAQSSGPAAPGPGPTPSPRAGVRMGDTKIYVPNSSGAASRFPFPKSPAWQLDAPGWYVPTTTSAGLGLFMWPDPPKHHVVKRMRSFLELPSLVAEANSLGTNVVYLCDWYQGASSVPTAQSWRNKGDYIPRSDLGGERAFEQGIAALHAQGGRLVVYVEGFLVKNTSNVGQEHGRDWSIMTTSGPLSIYAGGWMPCPGVEAWLAYMEGVGRRLGSYKLDGIFLDSYGYQHDHECIARSHGHALGDKRVFNRGCADLVRRMRAALRTGTPDGAVFFEGAVLDTIFEYGDGSLEAGIHAFVERWLWDAQGRTDTLLSGLSLDDWNQTVAIGAKMACVPQLREIPPNRSATEVFDLIMGKPDSELKKNRKSNLVFAGVHAWRNAGLAEGFPMPNLDDITPRIGSTVHEDDATDRGFGSDPLSTLRERAVGIDVAFAGRRPVRLAAYVKSLMDGRAAIAKVVDYGSSISRVESNSSHAVAWRFTGPGGTALTCANVADDPVTITFSNAPGAWKDTISGESFTSTGSSLAVAVPPHRARLLLGSG